jgi:hypothetical protein
MYGESIAGNVMSSMGRIDVTITLMFPSKCDFIYRTKNLKPAKEHLIIPRQEVKINVSIIDFFSIFAEARVDYVNEPNVMNVHIFRMYTNHSHENYAKLLSLLPSFDESVSKAVLELQSVQSIIKRLKEPFHRVDLKAPSDVTTEAAWLEFAAVDMTVEKMYNEDLYKTVYNEFYKRDTKLSESILGEIGSCELRCISHEKSIIDCQKDVQPLSVVGSHRHAVNVLRARQTELSRDLGWLESVLIKSESIATSISVMLKL